MSSCIAASCATGATSVLLSFLRVFTHFFFSGEFYWSVWKWLFWLWSVSVGGVSFGGRSIVSMVVT